MSSKTKARRGQSAAFLRELRRKNGLGEFAKGKRSGRAAKVAAPTARKGRAGKARAVYECECRGPRAKKYRPSAQGICP